MFAEVISRWFGFISPTLEVDTYGFVRLDVDLYLWFTYVLTGYRHPRQANVSRLKPSPLETESILGGSVASPRASLCKTRLYSSGYIQGVHRFGTGTLTDISADTNTETAAV